MLVCQIMTESIHPTGFASHCQAKHSGEGAQILYAWTRSITFSDSWAEPLQNKTRVPLSPEIYHAFGQRNNLVWKVILCHNTEETYLGVTGTITQKELLNLVFSADIKLLLICVRTLQSTIDHVRGRVSKINQMNLSVSNNDHLLLIYTAVGRIFERTFLLNRFLKHLHLINFSLVPLYRTQSSIFKRLLRKNHYFFPRAWQ